MPGPSGGEGAVVVAGAAAGVAVGGIGAGGVWAGSGGVVAFWLGVTGAPVGVTPGAFLGGLGMTTGPGGIALTVEGPGGTMLIPGILGDACGDPTWKLSLGQAASM